MIVCVFMRKGRKERNAVRLQSLQYFVFLVAVAAVYLHLPVRAQSPFLLAASWVFYAMAMPSMLPM